MPRDRHRLGQAKKKDFMATITTTQATVKYPAQSPRDTANGPRINVVFDLPGVGEIKVWGNPGDPDLTPLRKGQLVSLLYDGKSYKLLTQQAPPPGQYQQQTPAAGAAPRPARPTPGEPWDDEVKARIWQDLRQQRDVLVACHRAIAEKFVDKDGRLLISEEAIQKYATTLFIKVIDNY
jgi:hypothetical protein